MFNSIDKWRLDDTLPVISYQNDSYLLHRRSPSKGTLISKSHTFYWNIRYSAEQLSILIFVFEGFNDCRDF